MTALEARERLEIERDYPGIIHAYKQIKKAIRNGNSTVSFATDPNWGANFLPIETFEYLATQGYMVAPKEEYEYYRQVAW